MGGECGMAVIEGLLGIEKVEVSFLGVGGLQIVAV